MRQLRIQYKEISGSNGYSHSNYEWMTIRYE